jgi:anti-anti-sigma factor
MGESGGSIRLSLSGELDLAGSTDFRAALDGAQDDSTRVLLDLIALTLIDCSGLSTVFAAAERSRRERAVLILMDQRGQVRRLFDLIGPPPGVTVVDSSDLPHAGAWVAA